MSIKLGCSQKVKKPSLEAQNMKSHIFTNVESLPRPCQPKERPKTAWIIRLLNMNICHKLTHLAVEPCKTA
jgi:hypothetical protein